MVLPNFPPSEAAIKAGWGLVCKGMPALAGRGLTVSCMRRASAGDLKPVKKR